MTRDLIRASPYDDPDDDDAAERAERVALTRFRDDLDRARTPADFDAAQQRLDDALGAARDLPRSSPITTPTTARKA